MRNRYFDINRDFAVIKDGGFFCQACLIGKDKTGISPDPRYCQDCYDFLREAMETDTRWSHSASMPKLLVDQAKVAGTKNIPEDHGLPPVYPTEYCTTCGCGEYWLTDDNRWLCARCHPRPQEIDMEV